jgi:vancomycin resistance protein YoaR
VSEHRARNPEATRRTLIALGAGLVVLGVAAAGYLWLVLSTGTSVHPGTTVSGIPIGGMSREEAIETLQRRIGSDARKHFTLVAGEEQLRVSPKEMGIRLRLPATVDQAIGRSWNPTIALQNRFGTAELTPLVAIDDAVLDQEIARLAQTIDTTPVEPTLSVSGGKASLTPGVPGVELDQQATRELVVDQLLEPRRALTLPVRTVSPAVTEDAAQRARALAKAAIAEPVTVQAGGVTATIPTTAIVKALSFVREGGALVPRLDGAVLHESIADQLSEVETPGRDATFQITKGVPVVVPSLVGSGIEDEELATAVTGVLGASGDARNVTVSFGVREPELTTDEAKALGVTEKLSTFTQNFPYAAYRVQNIGQAAKYINGTLLMPGEVFSMNEVIKERTPENGYTEGIVIGPGGIFEEQQGGGVSASATAMWTGAFFAGMEQVSTRAHSIYISRYQPGLEATVAWGLFDMQFRNNTENAVFITTKMTNTSLRVTFWGTREYDEIKAEFGPKTNIRPFSVIERKKKVKEGCMEQAGINGFNINVDRVFYKDGAEVKRETFTTSYRPAPEVKCGVKKGKDDEELPLDEFPPGTPTTPGAPALPGNEFVNTPAA